MKKLPEHVSEDDIKEMFSVADTNGDGVLDIEEFGRMVIPSPIRSAKNRLRMKKQNFDIEELRRYMTLRMGQNFKWFSKSEGDPKGKVSLCLVFQLQIPPQLMDMGPGSRKEPH